MMGFLVGMIVGLGVGSVIGVVGAALCVACRRNSCDEK